MIIPASKIIQRAEKFIRLRRGEALQTTDRTFMLAHLCHKFAVRLYARGHEIAERWANR